MIAINMAAAAPAHLTDAIMMQPLWLQAWVGWMASVNAIGALVFIRRPEAKWILAAIIAAGVSMEMLFQQFGYQRILGLSHVVFWTPLLVYLWSRRNQWDLSQLSGKWIAAVFTTNLISLVIDYADVARYLMGERL